MRSKFLGFALFFCLSQFLASAASFPSTLAPQLSFGDTTLVAASRFPSNALKTKKPGLFGKLKNKLLGFLLKKELEKSSQSNPKKTLGWVAVGLFVAGVVVIAMGAGSAGVFVLLAGLATTIAALVVKKGEPGTTEEVAQKDKSEHKKNWGLRIAAILAIGGLVALLIALGSWGSH